MQCQQGQEREDMGALPGAGEVGAGVAEEHGLGPPPPCPSPANCGHPPTSEAAQRSTAFSTLPPKQKAVRPWLTVRRTDVMLAVAPSCDSLTPSGCCGSGVKGMVGSKAVRSGTARHSIQHTQHTTAHHSMRSTNGSARQ